MEKDIAKLEMRLLELENQLKDFRARREPVNISAEELTAYRKVKDALQADYGDMCGINDCQPCVVSRCSVTPISPCIIQRCDVECVCGPCNIGDYYRGSAFRFGRLGG